MLAGGDRGVDPLDTEHVGICFSKFRECGVAEERGTLILLSEVLSSLAE